MPQQPPLTGIATESKEIVDTTHQKDLAIFDELFREKPGYGHFRALMEDGWGWRKAAYIMWASTPRSERWPKTLGKRKNKETGEMEPGLADLLNCSRQKIAEWRRKNPAIDAMVSRTSSMRLIDHVADVDEALVKSAVNPDYKNKPDRELFYLRTKIIVPQSKIGLSLEDKADKTLLEAVSDAEFMQLAAEQGIVIQEEEEELDILMTEVDVIEGEVAAEVDTDD